MTSYKKRINCLEDKIGIRWDVETIAGFNDSVEWTDFLRGVQVVTWPGADLRQIPINWMAYLWRAVELAAPGVKVNDSLCVKFLEYLGRITTPELRALYDEIIRLSGFHADARARMAVAEKVFSAQ